MNPEVMGGAPCIGGLPITVSTLVMMITEGMSYKDILEEVPLLEAEDIDQGPANTQPKPSIASSTSLSGAMRPLTLSANASLETFYNWLRNNSGVRANYRYENFVPWGRPTGFDIAGVGGSGEHSPGSDER